MKQFIFLLAAVLLISVVAPVAANAQYSVRQDINKVPAAFYTTVWTAKSYAISQTDTSGIYNVGGTRLCALQMSYDDSVNVIVLVQKRSNPSGTWSFACGDTLNQTGGGVVTGTTVRTLTIRDVTTDKLGGAGAQIRIVTNFQGTLCGVTTPTYSELIRWKP